MTEPIETFAMAVRSEAGSVTIRHKKKSSFKLYSVLAMCLELCERCDRDPSEAGRFRKLFDAHTQGNGRHYVEKGSSIYQLVCRFVFHGTYLSNSTRYAQALCEAAKMQISSTDLAHWMKANGGVNALYFKRPLEQRTVYAKTLRLRDPVKIDRDRVFTLVLRWNSDNTFSVVKENADD